MRKINPKEIKIGQYYKQEWDGTILIKKRIKGVYRGMIRGKIIHSNNPIFKIGEEGHISYDSATFYLLTKEELFLEVL